MPPNEMNQPLASWYVATPKDIARLTGKHKIKVVLRGLDPRTRVFSSGMTKKIDDDASSGCI
jgi:hypothetical protein